MFILLHLFLPALPSPGKKQIENAGHAEFRRLQASCGSGSWNS
jgi:hypothetical protein